MNNAEFLKESHQYVDSLFEDFKNYKDEIMSLLDVFVDVCKRNKIHYFMIYGSLLGVIRDKGSIPWDYDVDVAVPIIEIDQLIKALENDLPDDYYFESNYTHPKSQFFQIRILKKNTNPSFVHVDVFYLIGGPTQDEEKIAFSQLIRKTFLHRFYYHVFDTEEYKSYSFLGKMYAKLKFRKEHGFKSKKANNKIFEEIIKKYDYNSTTNVAMISQSAEVFPKDYIEPIGEMFVDGHTYGVPSQPEKVLSALYKNYKEYLPIDNRFHEFYRVIKSYNDDLGKTSEVIYRNSGDN